jgi:hypothetical protein
MGFSPAVPAGDPRKKVFSPLFGCFGCFGGLGGLGGFGGLF